MINMIILFCMYMYGTHPITQEPHKHNAPEQHRYVVDQHIQYIIAAVGSIWQIVAGPEIRATAHGSIPRSRSGNQVQNY